MALDGLLGLLDALVSSVDALPSSPTFKVDKSLVSRARLSASVIAEPQAKSSHLHASPLDDLAFQPLERDGFRQEIVTSRGQRVDSILVEGRCGQGNDDNRGSKWGAGGHDFGHGTEGLVRVQAGSGREESDVAVSLECPDRLGRLDTVHHGQLDIHLRSRYGCQLIGSKIMDASMTYQDQMKYPSFPLIHRLLTIVGGLMLDPSLAQEHGQNVLVDWVICKGGD